MEEIQLLKHEIEKLKERNTLLVKGYIFCSYCDDLLKDIDGNPETSRYNVTECETCECLFCDSCNKDENVMASDYYSQFWPGSYCLKCR